MAIIVYVDGSCLGNGKIGSRTGAGVYFGKDDPRNAAFRVPGPQTNNRGELWAILHALRAISEAEDVEIRSDSQWAMKCLTREFNAKQNLDLLDEIWTVLERRSGHVRFTWVRGHADDAGNIAADKLARQGAQLEVNTTGDK